MADDFDSGPRSATFGGTTTLIPFACQQKGQSLRAAVDDYHQPANGKSVIDYAFDLILTHLSPQVIGQELPALICERYTSFKIFTTYDGLKLNDREIIDVLALAKREGVLTIIHAKIPTRLPG
jgi:dihydropyrimidinase